MEGFVEACGQHHLEEGQGVAGKALQLNGMYFIPDVSELSADAYPFVCDAWEFGLHAAVSFKLENIHMSRVDHVLEFFLPTETKDVSEHKLLIDGISSILQKNCRNSWVISGMELSEDNMDSVVRSEGAISDRSLPASLDHGIEIGVEAHEQDVGDQNSTFEAASTGITSILQQKSRNSWKDFSEQLSGANFSSEVRIENFETSDVRPAGISDSYYSLNSSEVRKFCNISNPTSDGVEVQEAHDQEMGEQNSTCGAASNEITSTLQKNPWKSWKDHSSEFMELCNISNPASDGEEVQEARDQEVEEQEFAFVPEAPSPDNEEGGRGTSRLNASARNKRRRTSKVWQYFEEVRENGEILAKCKSCSTRYRGESTRGTTNLHKHLKSCAGKK
ncbi:PREDICTED: protein NLP9-like isoform X2 [Populus euphratica]|uniref:Protein NLP9-like isoform X2 n=1 Tax=Populus euphratica TaxID=75702 RepID=A0AAJ6TS18_POPEU|nr:PREDICTED: protein NLP9-like isoform X2 [Populus euphratica]